MIGLKKANKQQIKNTAIVCLVGIGKSLIKVFIILLNIASNIIYLPLKLLLTNNSIFFILLSILINF